MVIDFDSKTPEKTVLAYIRILADFKEKVRIAYVKEGRITCELHGGIVIEAANPYELKEKLK